MDWDTEAGNLNDKSISTDTTPSQPGAFETLSIKETQSRSFCFFKQNTFKSKLDLGKIKNAVLCKHIFMAVFSKMCRTVLEITT